MVSRTRRYAARGHRIWGQFGSGDRRVSASSGRVRGMDESHVSTEPESIDETAAAGRRESWERMAADLASRPAVAGMLQKALAAKARADEVGVAALHQLNLPT